LQSSAMNNARGYQIPAVGWRLMEIFDLPGDGESKSFTAPVEFIDDTCGKFVCVTCHGDGRLDCNAENGGAKCDLCKDAGYLLIGL
jgi:hypothetical protein